MTDSPLTLHQHEARAIIRRAHRDADAEIASIRPVRLQLSRRKGFDLQALSIAANGLPAVNVARPSRWGNQFRIGGWYMIGDPDGHRGILTMSWCEALVPECQKPPFKLIETNAEAVDFFRRLHAGTDPTRWAPLRGCNLACWCKPGKHGEPCHADVLLELANKEAS